MANELRVRQNFLGGLIEDNPLTVGATTLTSSALTAMVAIGTTQHLPIVLDVDGLYGEPEIVYVTAHTAASNTATILRAQEGTVARQHLRDMNWSHGPTAADLNTNTALGRPQGVFQRRYTFDTTTEGWTTGAGSLAAANARLALTNASNTNAIVQEPAGATAVPTGEVYADFFPTTTDPAYGNDLALLFRLTDASNYYGFSFRLGANSTAAPQFSFLKNVAGTLTSIGSTASNSNVITPFYFAANSGPVRVMVRFVGSVFHCYFNENFVMSVTDASLTTGRVGVRSFGTGVEMDNFTVYSLTAPWTPVNY